MGKVYNFLGFIIFRLVILMSIFQFYFFHIGNSYFSLTEFLTILLIFVVIRNISLLNWKPLFFIVIIIVLEIISFLWSSDLKLGMKFIFIFLLFIIVTTSSYYFTQKYFKHILDIFKYYYILLVFLIILIIIFRLNPIIEMEFLSSKITNLFINPNVIYSLFNGIKNNIFDPEKSGGFFVNANVAAAYLGINLFICYGLWKAYNIKFFKIIILLIMFGILCTGSKAGLILMILIFILIKFLYAIKHNLSLHKMVFIVFLLLNIIVFLLFLLTLFGNKILNRYFLQLDSTISIRLIIWNFALKSFIIHPIEGLGFGGWQKYFSSYASEYGLSLFPPHNTLIYLWANSGILVVIFAIFFIFYILKFGFTLLSYKNKELSGLGISVLGSFLWTFIHGMGTNFGLVGEVHMVIILGFILGYSYARFKYYKERRIWTIY